MLDMGFIPDVTRIINLLPTQRQSLLFSATFSEEVKKLADKMLRSPVLVEVAKRNTISEMITHRVHPVTAESKRALLVKLLKSPELSQALVFARTKIGTHRLSRELQRAGIAADSIHGDKSQQDRLKVLDAFKNGTVRVLVATDVAARGLDIDELPHVINFDLSQTPEDYIHRIGRTGRAGKPGTAISLVSAEEIPFLREIEKLIKHPIEQIIVPGFGPEIDYTHPSKDKKERRGLSKKDLKNTKKAYASLLEKNPLATNKSRAVLDGFDFDKPYQSTQPIHAKNLVDSESTKASRKKPPLPRLRRPVAVLLGGHGRKL